jgi:hypothetical protein
MKQRIEMLFGNKGELKLGHHFSFGGATATTGGKI